MSTKGKEEKCSSDSEDHDDHSESDSELDLILEKMNLGPKKKLLVIDLNGLLLKRVHHSDHKGIPSRRIRTSDMISGNFFLYKRPFSEEFMKFCLQRFEVGIWSSAMEHNIVPALRCAMGSLKDRLLFVWDKEKCTDSGVKSLENNRKPLFFKELQLVWDCIKKGGPHSAANTLLIDDNPYKAFLNPPNTAIFPERYKPEDKDDKALDPEGELCSYLKGLSDSHDVPFYVKEHLFGQPAITSTHPDWDFYSGVRSSLRK